MLLIPCPHCGPRHEGEFTYGGPRRHFPPLAADTETWRNALFGGHNPNGPLTELWYHTGGCERWIEVRRDTVTHEILSATIPQPEANIP